MTGRLFSILLLTLISISGSAQIISVNPVFPTADDTITLVYDATQGNAGLVGESPIFAHTGVITNLSGPGQWRYVQGNWGQYDPKVLMQQIGSNRYMLRFHIRSFYGVPTQEEIRELAFVFRNEDGSKEGKTVDGQDIFTPVYSPDSDLLLARIAPFEDILLPELGDTIPITIATSVDADISITDNGDVVAATSGKELITEIIVNDAGFHNIIITANTNGIQRTDTFYYSVIPDLVVADPPTGTKPGVNRIDDNTTILAIYAPDKDHITLLSDLNNWKPDAQSFLNLSTDGKLWWIQLEGLSPQNEYRYQYLIEGMLRVADPMSEKVLDPWNDAFIPEATYPDLIEYPAAKTTNIVSVFTPKEDSYNWSDDDFVPPPKEQLIVYELLISDFLEEHNFQTLTDTLDYLEKLGINAIELMPVTEFEGNISWGYNVSFHKALDKYYGTPETFKRFINEAHNRGIAIILDIVLNHAFGQSPLVQMYWDQQNNRPSADNPWFNQVPRHPFNVGYDFNHESQATKLFVEEILTYWMEEFRIDGYRFDLSKGFTQRFSSNNDQMSAYDASRVSIIQDMADIVWAINPNAYVILEHFAYNSEEKELSDRGMMLWGNMNHQFNEATMGYSSNLSGISYQSSGKGWDQPNLVGYMESHDEERLMYKNLQYGNSSGEYDVTEISTALQRVALAAHFLIPVPGPKMIWQFGELGYDFSINRCADGTVDPACRLTPKPIRWDYLNQPDRKKVLRVFQELNFLKTNYGVFSTTDFDMDVSSTSKQITLRDADTSVVIVGNFNLALRNINVSFPENGWWYEYHTGDSVQVTDFQVNIPLEAGGYGLYSSSKLNKPDFTTSIDQPSKLEIDVKVFPNPGQIKPTVLLTHIVDSSLEFQLYNARGQRVEWQYFDKSEVTSPFEWRPRISELDPGLYYIRITSEKYGNITLKWVCMAK